MEKTAKRPASKNRPDRRKQRGPRFDDADAIVRAAIKCFKHYGVAKTSLEDVAREAGISRPLLYLFFPNRQALIDGAINFEISRLIERQTAPMRAYSGFAEAIVQGSCLSVREGRESALLAELMEFSSVRHAPELLLDPAKPAHEIVLKLWKPVFDKGRASGELRPELSDDDLMEWLMNIHYVFLLREDIGEERIAELMELFVMPALAAGTLPRRSKRRGS